MLESDVTSCDSFFPKVGWPKYGKDMSWRLTGAPFDEWQLSLSTHIFSMFPTF